MGIIRHRINYSQLVSCDTFCHSRIIHQDYFPIPTDDESKSLRRSFFLAVRDARQ